MAKAKSGKKAPMWQQLSLGVKASLLIGLFVLSGLALWKGGQIILTPGKMVISGPSEKAKAPAPSQPNVQQKAIASQDKSRALNSLGNINQGNTPSPRPAQPSTSQHISQHAQADGKHGVAMNAAGDININ